MARVDRPVGGGAADVIIVEPVFAADRVEAIERWYRAVLDCPASVRHWYCVVLHDLECYRTMRSPCGCRPTIVRALGGLPN